MRLKKGYAGGIKMYEFIKDEQFIKDILQEANNFKDYLENGLPNMLRAKGFKELKKKENFCKN